MGDWQRHVTAHGDLRSLDERLWVVTAGEPQGHLTRNMFIYRLDDGGLLIHGAHALRTETMDAIEAIGPMRLMIVASQFHCLHESLYAERYPQLTVVCPVGSRAKVTRHVRVDDDLEAVAEGYGFRWLAADGVKAAERVVELPIRGGSAWLLGDMMMNLPHLPGLDGWLFKLLGSTGFFGMTAIGRFLLLKDKAAFKAWLVAQAGRDDLRVIGVSHGDVIAADCQERLRSAAGRL
jgi:hypothetical protein